jgi:hypothetical protein
VVQEACEEACRRSARADRHHDQVWLRQLAAPDLLRELTRGVRVAARSRAIRAARGHQVVAGTVELEHRLGHVEDVRDERKLEAKRERRAERVEHVGRDGLRHEHGCDLEPARAREQRRREHVVATGRAERE